MYAYVMRTPERAEVPDFRLDSYLAI